MIVLRTCISRDKVATLLEELSVECVCYDLLVIEQY